MESFCDLAEPLGIHSSLIVLLEELLGSVQLLLYELLASQKFLRVQNDLVLLIDHFALHFTYLTLENLHLLGPREPIAGHGFAVTRISLVYSICAVHTDVTCIQVSEALTQTAAEV